MSFIGNFYAGYDTIFWLGYFRGGQGHWVSLKWNKFFPWNCHLTHLLLMPQLESKFSTPVSSLYVLLQFAGCLQNFMSVLDKASQTKVLARKIWYLKCKIISWKQNENWTSLQYYLGKYDLLQKILKERFNPASEKRKNIAQSFYPGYDSPNRQQTPRNPLNCTCGLLQVHLRAASGIQMFS